MPQHKSCEKRIKTSAKARSRNRAYRAKVKLAVRNVHEATTPEEANVALKEAVQVLDRAAGKGILHKNRAADKKSRLSEAVRNRQA